MEKEIRLEGNPNIPKYKLLALQGDLTPVLKAYERDLRSPFVGTVRGDLVRALLIQSTTILSRLSRSASRLFLLIIAISLFSSCLIVPMIVNSVKEGDLTPVLKAYERDLRSPFVGTVRGDLVFPISQ
jgi:hypothetical protein